MENYIEYTNVNPMWNEGYIHVVVNSEEKEFISVDDYLKNNTNEDIWGIDDLIEFLQEKYNIKKVIREEKNWR